MEKPSCLRHIPLLVTAAVFALLPLLVTRLAALHDQRVHRIVSLAQETLLQDGVLSAPPAAQANRSSPAAASSAAATALSAEVATRRAAAKLRRSRAGRACNSGADGAARSFIMVFMGHSGSSAITSELSAHTRIRLTPEPEAVDHHELKHNATAALAYVRAFFAAAIADGKIPGFKMRPRHIIARPEAWRMLAREFGTRIVWNYRENLVKQAVGEYSYRKLGDRSVVEGLRSETAVKKRCETGAGCSFAIDDMDFFHRTLQGGVLSNGLISSAAHLLSAPRDAGEKRLCVHELPYEDYLYDRRGAMEGLSRFLGIPFEDNKAKRYKATKDNMCEVVENWDALCRNLYGCQAWRGMMDDAVNGCTCRAMGEKRKYCGNRK